MAYRYRLICRTCSLDADGMGCWEGGWSELSEEAYPTVEDAAEAADDETGDCPWDWEIVDGDGKVVS